MIEVYADANRGIYIPQFFARTCADGWTISARDKEILLDGPEHEDYWNIWNRVLDYAECKDSEGVVWRLHHAGDLFAYSDELPEDFWNW